MHCPSWSALKRRRIYYHISAKWLEQFHFQEVRISISRLNFKIQNRKVVSWEIAPLKCKCNVVPKNFNHGSAREWQATLHVSQQQKNVCRNAAIKIRIVQDFSTWHKQIKLHFSYFKKPQRYAIRAGTVGSLNPALQSTLKSLFLFILSDFHWIYRWETRIWELAKIASQNKYWWCKRLTKSCCLYICDYMILLICSYGYSKVPIFLTFPLLSHSHCFFCIFYHRSVHLFVPTPIGGILIDQILIILRIPSEQINQQRLNAEMDPKMHTSEWKRCIHRSQTKQIDRSKTPLAKIAPLK